MKAIVVSITLGVFAGGAYAQASEIANSHIRANVPDAKDFDALFRRDVAVFFANRTGKAVRVEYRLLRNQPTQSGVAFPKYYAWVNVFLGDSLLEQGAVRLAAESRERFEVLNYLEASEIRANPGEAASIFPASLVPRILADAGASK